MPPYRGALHELYEHNAERASLRLQRDRYERPTRAEAERDERDEALRAAARVRRGLSPIDGLAPLDLSAEDFAPDADRSKW